MDTKEKGNSYLPVEYREEDALLRVPGDIPRKRPEKGKQGRLGPFRWLCFCVTLFAAAFLLCEVAQAYHMQAWAEQLEGPGEMISALRADFRSLLQKTFADGKTTTVPPAKQDGTNTSKSPMTDVPATTDVVTTPRETVTGTPTGSQTLPTPPPLTPEEVYAFDETKIPAGMTPIVPMDLSLSGYGESFHYNDTDYTLSIVPSADATLPAMAGVSSDEVTVLVYHTHATEGFSPAGSTYYDPAGELARTTDPSESVIAVGEALCRVLEEKGIHAIHDTTLHDLESYRDSYSRAAETIQKYLRQYPSIQLVIDVHRDAIVTSAGYVARPVALIDGETVAQVMCVVGSDAAGTANAGWRNNLDLAVNLRHRLNEAYENICRPVYVKRSTYNQQYAPASLLLEIGAGGNSLEEAIRAAELVGKTLADMW